jgi:hypothetical protein
MIARRWSVVVTLLAMAGVAVVVLPPRPVPDNYSFASVLLGFSYRYGYGGSDNFTGTVRRARVRHAEAVAAPAHGAADVQAARGPLALHSAREPFLVVVRDPGVPIGIAREWLADAERELSFFPRVANAGIPVIIGLHTRDFVPASGLPHTVSVGARMLYAEGRDTACITDLRLPGRDTTRVPARYWHLQSAGWWENRRLGRCALYARYGVPGQYLQAWYGLSSQWRWSDDGQLRASLARRDVRRQPIDRTRQWGYGNMPEYLMCLDHGVACDGIFGARTIPGFDSWYDRGGAGSLIAELLKSSGPDRFVRFWQSALPVDSAARDAYGVSIGSLGREALQRQFIPPEPAGAHRGAAATTVVWLAGFLGLAAVLSRRKTMGL